MAELNHTDVVRERILEKLIYGEYMPGHTFKLREMLESVDFRGVSQTPCREALLQLVAKDILVGQRGFSVRVPIPSVEHLTEVRSIRYKLEVMAAIKVMEQWTPEGIDRLEQIHKIMLACKAVGDVQGTLRANAQFHFALYGEDHKSYLSSMIQTLWAITGPSIRFLYEEGKPMDVSGYHPHDDVIQALRTKNRVLLEKGIMSDLSGTGAKILEVLRQKVSPEALAIQQFKKMDLVRARDKCGRKIQKKI